MKLPSRKEIQDRQKTESPIESILLREFHLLGFYSTPQYKVGNYRIDLAFLKERVAIECDGKEWHSTNDQIENDKKKDEFLKSEGWKVIRITGSDIYKDADEIVKILIGMKTNYRKRFNEDYDNDENEDEDEDDEVSDNSYLKINYETDNFDDIEEKEEAIRNIIEENENREVGEFTKLGDIAKKRFNKTL